MGATASNSRQDGQQEEEEEEEERKTSKIPNNAHYNVETSQSASQGFVVIFLLRASHNGDGPQRIHNRQRRNRAVHKQ
jgi:hypothetical protein